MLFENTWNQFVGGKIDYQNFSDHGWVMAVDASAETYDVVIGEKELLDNGEVDPSKIYRAIKATVPFSVVQYGVGDPVLVGYLNGDRNHPLVVGASDNIVMDVTKVSVNIPSTGDMFVADGTNLLNQIHKYSSNDLSLQESFGAWGDGQDQTRGYGGMATDNEFLYIVVSGKRIQKRLISDMSFVSEYVLPTSPTTTIPRDCCVDSTYLYVVADNSGRKIIKLLKSDMSFVSEISTGPSSFYSQNSIATDGVHIYTTGNFAARVVKRLASDLSFVSEILSYLGPIDIDTNYVYVRDTSWPVGLVRLDKNLNFVSVHSLPSGPAGYSVTASNFYVLDYNNLTKYDMPVTTSLIETPRLLGNSVQHIDHYSLFF